MRLEEKDTFGFIKRKSINASMEQLNRVELIGTVGTTRITETGEVRKADFSLVTNYVCRSKDGTATIETTWHHVVCFEGEDVCSLSEISKGASLHVIGRIRRRRYTTENGENRNNVEVFAARVEKLPDGVCEPEHI